MAITDFSIGMVTKTSARLCFRSDVSEDVPLTFAGGTIGPSNPIAANTAVNDGWIYFDVTNLTAGTLYAFSVPGRSGSVTTHPASGMLRTIVFSCIEPGCDNLALRSIVDEGPHMVISEGDTPYTNTTLNRWGVNAAGSDSSLANSKDVAVYRASHLQLRRMPSFRRMVESVPFLYMPDDHEYPFDNPSPTDLAGYQAGVTGAGAAIQADLDAAFAAAKAAVIEYSLGNPANADTPGDANPLYFRFTQGSIEFFVINCIEYRSPVSATDNASKTMLGANQKAWLIARLLASTAPFKCIITPKELFKGGINSDTWYFYQTERLEILEAIKDVTTVFWIAGDSHLPNVQFARAGALSADQSDAFCMTACPAGQQLNGSQGDPAGTGTALYAIWKRGDNQNEYPIGYSKVYARIDDYGSRIVVALRDVFAGGHHEPAGTLKEYTFIPGTNVPLQLSGPVGLSHGSGISHPSGGISGGTGISA